MRIHDVIRKTNLTRTLSQLTNNQTTYGTCYVSAKISDILFCSFSFCALLFLSTPYLGYYFRMKDYKRDINSIYRVI